MSLIHSIVTAFLVVTQEGLQLYKMAVIISAIMSWLVGYNIVNTRNNFVRAVGEFLYRITEPALRPIRRVVPPIGGIDLSAVVLFFIIVFLQIIITHQLVRWEMY